MWPTPNPREVGLEAQGISAQEQMWQDLTFYVYPRLGVNVIMLYIKVSL